MGRAPRLAGALATVALLTACSQLRLPFTGSPHSIGAGGPVDPGRGAVVFSDDFSDPGSGWPTEPLASGTTFNYEKAGYVVVAKGDLVHFAGSPYDRPLRQLGMSVTAKVSADSPPGSGFGVGCRRGSGSSEVRYELTVSNDGSWMVGRRHGQPSPDVPPETLKRGRASIGVGPFPTTVEGVCATLQDGRQTRLVLFIGGKRLADLADTSDSALPGSGWTARFDVISVPEGPATVTASRFVERDAAA